MNIYHYILLAFSVLGVLSTLVERKKEKNKIGFFATLLVALTWCSLIILSAYN